MYLNRKRTNTFFEEIGFRKDAKNALVYTNEEKLKKQKGVLSHMISQINQNYMQGKSLTQISLPIKIFDSKSLLEKVALFMKTAPFFLDQAAEIL